MVGVDISMPIQLVSFLVTLVLLNTILFKPIRRVVKERKEKVALSEAEIERLRLGAEDKLAAFQAQLDSARAEGANKRMALRKVAQDEERGLLDSVSKEIEATLTRARAEIAADAAKAASALQAQSSQFAGAVVEKILGRSAA